MMKKKNHPLIPTPLNFIPSSSNPKKLSPKRKTQSNFPPSINVEGDFSFENINEGEFFLENIDEGDDLESWSHSDEDSDGVHIEDEVVDVEVDNTIHGGCEDVDEGNTKYDSEELLSLVDSDEEREHHEDFNAKTDFSREIVLKVGLRFPSTSVLRKALVAHSIQNGYDFLYTHNERDRVTIFCKSRCDCPIKKGRKKHGEQCDVKCLFRVHARKLRGEESFQIKSLNLNHTCGRQDMNSKVTAEYLAHRYLENWRADPSWKITAFQAQVLRDLDVKVGYYKCWFAKAQALRMIHGNSDDEYKKVWDYAEAIKKHNPGSSSFVKVDCISKPIPIFQRMYMCFDACKKGFVVGCRPFIGVDGCHLKGVYKGQCIVAIGQDGNNNIYPVAWAIVEVEDKNSWVWFLELLLKDIGIEDQNLTIMSDRQKGLLEAFQIVCPNAEIRFCVRHIFANFKQHFKGNAFKESLWSAARATTKEEFNKQMEGLKLLSKEAHNYLSAIPPQHWSRHAMSQRCKSEMLTNNICETFNNVIKPARDKPILSFMEWVRKYVMKRHFTKLDAMKDLNDKVMPYALKKIELHEKACRYCSVDRVNLNEFEVGLFNDTFVVNLVEKKCSCYLWELSGIPCTHAIRCIKERRLLPVDFVHRCYGFDVYKAAYGTSFHAMPGANTWVKTGLPEPQPPLFRVMPGRPKKKRNKEPGEGQGQEKESKFAKRAPHKNKCKKCGIYGHNSRTCKVECHPIMNPSRANLGGRPRNEGSTSYHAKRKCKRKLSEATSQNIEVQTVEYQGSQPPHSQSSQLV